MNVPFYLFSNTFQLDFHELVIPRNESDVEKCRRVLSLKEIAEKSGSSFTVFAKTLASKHLIGATFNVEELNEVSSRYFRVARCNGRTPTQVSVVFVLPLGECIFINKSLLTELVRSVFTKQIWNEQKISLPKFGSVELEMKENKFVKKIHAPMRTKYGNIVEMLNKFNAAVSARKDTNMNIVFSILQKSRSCPNTYCSVKVSVND